ncbi:hypothetical protein DFH06DRAFT_1360202 [Mycena polygramma]|nr:hypothetical protein DFH06DRAFT_1360202 [Mycena polygramma]
MPPSSNPEPIALSPIDTLPPELLCSIFTLAIPQRKPTWPAVPVLPFVRRRSEPQILAGPWIFGQVCSHWRILSISFPGLWTSITLPTDRLEQLESLFFKFLVVLVSLSWRWRTLHLYFESYQYPPAAFGALGPQTLPLLHELILSGSTVSSFYKYDGFVSAPALRRVVLSEVGELSVPNILLPWAHLTSYTATYTEFSKYLRDLAAAVNLVECDIDFGFDGAVDDLLGQDIVTLPRLRRLVLSCPPLLTRIASPALQTLYIVGAVDPVFPFLHRSGCAEKLTSLTIVQCVMRAPRIRHPSETIPWTRHRGTKQDVSLTAAQRITQARKITAILRHTPGLKSLALDLDDPSSPRS